MHSVALIACGLLVAALLIGLLFRFGKNAGKEPVSRWLLLAAGMLLSFLFVWRSLQLGFVALTGIFDSLVFFAAAVCYLAFWYRSQRRLPYSAAVYFGAMVAAFGLLAIANSPIAPVSQSAPLPILRSGWLLIHVSLAFLGEAFFVFAFVAAIAFLATKDAGKRERLDRLIYTAIATGYPLFTIGALVFGAIWAEQAWGRWWNWDPKETWALVTWLVYTLYLHVRFVRRRGDSLPAVIAVVGFLCALFTLFGVNYLLPGLHSYR
jgi:cytochrome c-type biogenesis protein CcsB